MTSKEFSIGHVLKYGWQLMKEHFLLFLGAILVGLALSIGSWAGYQWSLDNHQHWSITALIWIVAFVIGSIIHLGLINISLRCVDQKNVNLGHLFTMSPRVFQFIVANILYGLIVTVGLILFIVPGIYWAIKYSLFPYFIIDKNAGPLEALGDSSVTTEGAKWDLFAFGIVSIIISWLGIICLVIGLFVALPTLWIASAAIYRRLASQTPMVKQTTV